MRPCRPSCRRLFLTSQLQSSRANPPPPAHQIPQSRCIRSFHSTPYNQSRRGSRYPSIKQNEIEAIRAKRLAKAAMDRVSTARYKSYTDADLKSLAKKYSPKQMEAVRAAEEAVSKFDIATQGKLRRDPLQFQYLDDFSRIEQTIDKKVEKLRGDEQNYREMTDLPYYINDATFDEARTMAAAADEAELENCGEWVPAPLEENSYKRNGSRQDFLQKNDQDPPNTGIFAKMILKRTTAQIGKAALKRYLGVKTFKEAKEHCENIDEQNWLMRIANKDVAQLQETLDYPSSNIPEDRRQPLHSEHFQTAILHDPKYKECYQWARENPPPKTSFGMPAEDAIEDEMLFSFPDIAPAIPKLDDPAYVDEPEPDQAADEAASQDQEDFQGIQEEELDTYKAAARTLGLSVKEIVSFRYKVLSSHRVVNQTAMGKVQSFYVLTVAGNGNGMLGIGEGKSRDMPKARLTSRLAAIRNMVPILRYENRTIYGQVQGKVGACQVEIGARQPGFGVRGSRHVFEMAKCAGIYDLGAKRLRGRNDMNTAKAIWQALRSQRHPDDIARARGRKMVDVRKVYYSGKI